MSKPVLGAAPGTIRPRQGEQITVLIEVNGVPVTHVALAGMVSESTIVVPRKASEQLWAVEPQGQATVLFIYEGRWYNWPMRVEEVLPSSYYLVSIQDPGEGERRRFVRTHVALRVAIGRAGHPRPPWQDVEADLSVSGVRMLGEHDLQPGEVVALTIRAEGHDITAQAMVVRRLVGLDAPEIAFEFVQLSSADEDRIAQIVFKTRETALYERIGRREFS